jgi:hypothetical protein
MAAIEFGRERDRFAAGEGDRGGIVDVVAIKRDHPACGERRVERGLVADRDDRVCPG